MRSDERPQPLRPHPSRQRKSLNRLAEIGHPNCTSIAARDVAWFPKEASMFFRHFQLAALLFSGALLSLAAPALAQSVGVTSATAGDPLGKPPSERERVLQVGIDVKANELITTGLNDRAHLVFLDGTALTVGPQARLSIDRFVYDANNRLGELAINATQGVFRLVGGKISKTRPIVVSTPSSTLTIRGGIMMFAVTPHSTVATFVFGWEMTAAAAGRQQSVKAPGWQIVTQAGQAPAAPRQLAPGELGALMAALEAEPGRGNGSNVSERLRASGLADHNSGAGPNAPPSYVQGGPNPAAANAISDTLNQKNFGPGIDPHRKQ